MGYVVSSLCVSTWRRRLAKQLLAIAGADEGQAFSLAERDALFIGSGPLASVRFFDPTVSRFHCRVRAHHDQILVVNFKSECGTFVNGHRIIPYGLWPGEVLRVGQTCLCLVTSGPERPSDKKPEAAPAKVGTAGRTSTVLERQCTPCLRAGRRLSVLLSKTPSVRFGRPIRFRQGPIDRPSSLHSSRQSVRCSRNGRATDFRRLPSCFGIWGGSPRKRE